MRLLNPVLLGLLRTPLGGPIGRSVLVLRFSGRRTGRRYEVPATAHRWDDGLMVLTGARWRLNFRGGRDVDVVFEGRTTPMRGVLVEYARTVAETYAKRFEELGLEQAQRRLGLKVNVGRLPTVAELEALVEREHLSMVWLKAR